MLQDYAMASLIDAMIFGNKIQNTSNISEKGHYALDATEKNPDIEDTLAEQIADLNNKTNALKASVVKIISLPNGASTGDGQIEDAKVGIDGETYDTLGDSIRGQITRYNPIQVSNSKPTNSKAKVWINTSEEDSDETDLQIPEIKDKVISSTDTWSSKKINELNEALLERIRVLEANAGIVQTDEK